jgi:hypothetical protein
MCPSRTAASSGDDDGRRLKSAMFGRRGLYRPSIKSTRGKMHGVVEHTPWQ